MAEINKLPEREPPAGRPKSSLPPGGQPPYGGGMEARLAMFLAVRQEIKEVRDDAKEFRREHRSDNRLLWGALITAALGLAGMIGGLGAIMAHGFKWF